jgi:3-oxoacyl-[acyl-carrier-protein] synthase II
MAAPIELPTEGSAISDPAWPFPILPRTLAYLLRLVPQVREWDLPARTGLVLGFAKLTSEPAYLDYQFYHRHDVAAMGNVAGFMAGPAADEISQRLGFWGPRLCLDSACATGSDALIAGIHWLQSGAVDDVVVLAASGLVNPIAIALFHQLQALHPKADPEASCPFDRRRKGFVMGEAAAAVWLSRSGANQPLHGIIHGFGQSMSAQDMTGAPGDLGPALAAAKAALGNRSRVAYVSAHGTATPGNDRMETWLHHALFGAAAPGIPMSSIKSMIGHTIAAAALIEAIVACEALNRQMAPPTINYRVPDPECLVDCVPNQAKPIRGDLSLSHAFAFGGHNSCLLLGRTAA